MWQYADPMQSYLSMTAANPNSNYSGPNMSQWTNQTLASNPLLADYAYQQGITNTQSANSLYNTAGYQSFLGDYQNNNFANSSQQYNTDANINNQIQALIGNNGMSNGNPTTYGSGAGSSGTGGTTTPVTPPPAASTGTTAPATNGGASTSNPYTSAEVGTSLLAPGGYSQALWNAARTQYGDPSLGNYTQALVSSSPYATGGYSQADWTAARNAYGVQSQGANGIAANTLATQNSMSNSYANGYLAPSNGNYLSNLYNVQNAINPYGGPNTSGSQFYNGEQGPGGTWNANTNAWDPNSQSGLGQGGGQSYNPAGSAGGGSYGSSYF